MSKHTIDYSCGHSADAQIYGPTADRDRKADWMARGVCAKCYAAQRAAERETHNAAAAAANAADGAPALTGTERQIAWAETLRRPVVEAYARAMAPEMIARRASATGEVAERAAKSLAALAHVAAIADARWWIDRRDALPCEAKAVSDVIAKCIMLAGVATTNQ